MTREEFESDQLLTPDDIARRHGYTTTKPITAAIRRGELRAHRSPCGRRWQIALSDYAAYVKSLELKPAERPTSAPTPARRARRRSDHMPIPS